MISDETDFLSRDRRLLMVYLRSRETKSVKIRQVIANTTSNLQSRDKKSVPSEIIIKNATTGTKAFLAADDVMSRVTQKTCCMAAKNFVNLFLNILK